jgi:hypothetical protein
MASTEDTNRFNLPVEALIQELIEESHPGLNAAPGSAFYDTLVSTSAILFQHFRDYSSVIQRNQSLSNYSAMLPEELDRLAANYGVSRQQGRKSRGVQRITYASPATVTVTTGVLFSDSDGHSYRPVTSTSITATTMANNVLTSTGEYYVDVVIEAVSSGADYTVDAGAINTVTGLSGILRTFNPSDMSTGIDADGNAQLYSKIISSIANRDLVKASGIEAAIIESFPAVRQVKVVGYGDDEMTRDVATVTLADQTVFERSFAQKVNLPLNGSGNVQWTASDGSTISAPVGGYVGAISDMVGRDFGALKVSIDGRVVEYVAAQQNFQVRMLNPSDPDYGKIFTVTRVEEVPIAAGGQTVRVLRLDKPFADTTTVTSANLAQYPYTLRGYFATNQFHLGGKVDVYVDSRAVETKEVFINVLPAVNDETSDVSEIPIAATFTDEADNSLFEGNVGFSFPVISIEKVEKIDPSNSSVVIQELTPDVHYAYVSAEQRGKFTEATDDVLVIRGSEQDSLTSDILPLFVGSRIKVTYSTSTDIPSIQSFIDDAVRRDITKDIMIRASKVAQLDIDLAYTGKLGATAVATILSEYVQTKTFGDTLTVQELLTTLAFFGVSNVQLPVILRARVSNDNGSYTFYESEDRIQLAANQIFAPTSSLSIVKQ